MKVLLVDDNESTTKMASAYLKAKNNDYQINTANNGLQALEYYSSLKPDVVVLDISMPGIDGIETLSRLFKIDKNANVIMASATDALRTIEICLQKGASGYISKPYSPEDLLTSIQNAQKGGTCKRELTVFFTCAAKKLEVAIQKITHENVRIKFDDMDVIQLYSDSMEKLSAMKKGMDNYKIKINDDYIAYSIEIGGQLDGIIISAINKTDLGFIFSKNHIKNFNVEDWTIDFFNIMNSYLVSQLSDSMNVKLDALPVRKYVEGKDSFVEDKDLTRVKFNIRLANRVVILDVFLWLNMSHLFKHLF